MQPAPGALLRTVAALLCSGVLRLARTCDIHRLFNLRKGNAGSPCYEQPESASGDHADVLRVCGEQRPTAPTLEIFPTRFAVGADGSLAHDHTMRNAWNESIRNTLQTA
jgi:hypothetical protein